LLASWIGAANATAFDVFFNGPSNYGISEADAIAARDSAGVPWVSPPVLSTAAGYYAIESSGVLSFAPVPPVGTINTSLESWTVENVSGESLEGVSYLLFGQTVPFEKNGEFIEFDPENVGISINGANWVIIPTNQSGTDYYYPAIVLDGIELEGAVSGAFDVNYVVTEPLPQAPAHSGTYQLPRLAVARAFLPAAEPLPEVDPGGNSAPAGNTSYGYDPQGRLNQVVLSSGSVIAYGYDEAGNRSETFFGPVDSDGDGIPDYADNCIDHPNPDQAEGNLGFGLACDTGCYDPATCGRCDANGDGKIGIPDIVILISQYGNDCQASNGGFPTACSADCTGDNLVGVFDLQALLGDFGSEALAGPQGPLSDQEALAAPPAVLEIAGGVGEMSQSAEKVGAASTQTAVPALDVGGLAALSLLIAMSGIFLRQAARRRGNSR